MEETLVDDSIIGIISQDVDNEVNAIEYGNNNIDNFYNIQFDPYLKLNLDFRRYSGEWWYLGGYSQVDQKDWPLSQVYKRIKSIYKWNKNSRCFDIENHCYSEYPNVKNIIESGFHFPIKCKEIISGGKYDIINSMIVCGEECYPRKMTLYYQNKDNIDKNKSNFYIYMTDYDNYSIVGTPNKKGLWIFTRKYQIKSRHAKQLLNYVDDLKFNPSNIISDKNAIIQ